MKQRRRVLAAALHLPLVVTALSLAAHAWAQNANAVGGSSGQRSPDILGFALGMPLDMAVRKAQSIAPSGSVTLPALRREPFLVVGVEAPVALAPQPAEPAGTASGGNFYTMLNNAPRILKTQPTRSSHVGFIRLVADSNERRLVRVVFEPAFVYWQDGLDAAERTPAELSEDLRKRFSADVRLVAAAQPAGRASATRDRPATSAGPGSVAGWELRVAAARKSVVLTDPARLPDDFASRLQLD